MNSPKGLRMGNVLRIPKIILLACLIPEIVMKKTLTLGFGRRPKNNSNFLSIFLIVRLKSHSHSENHLPSLLNSADSYEEDIKT